MILKYVYCKSQYVNLNPGSTGALNLSLHQATVATDEFSLFWFIWILISFFFNCQLSEGRLIHLNFVTKGQNIF